MSAQEFATITGCDESTAASYMEMSGGDLETAMALFFDGGGAAAPAAMETDSLTFPDWWDVV